jgi:hypothetical protein
MRKYIVFILLVLLAGVGIYLYSNANKNGTGSSMQGHNMKAMDGKPVAQSHRSYEMEVSEKPAGIDPNQPAIIKYRVKNDKGEVLKNYSIVHEKLMHFIVVRKDLQYFQHLHPNFYKNTGEFTIAVTFPTDGPYRLFPDFTPATSEDNPQQLPVTVNTDVNVGDMGKYTAKSVTPDTSNVKNVSGYQITYNMPSDLKSQSEFSYNLQIGRNGQPVTNLQTYLGALGHGVILREDTLDFIHTHAGEVKQGESMEGMDHGAMTMEKEESAGPKINFSTTFTESGKYKIFTQFQHEGKVITTDYAIEVK